MITYYKHIDGAIAPVEIVKHEGKWVCGTNLHVFNRPEQPVLYEFENDKGQKVRMSPSEFTEEYSVEVDKGHVVMFGAPSVKVVAKEDTREWDNIDEWATSDNLSEGWSVIGLKEAHELIANSHKNFSSLIEK